MWQTPSFFPSYLHVPCLHFLNIKKKRKVFIDFKILKQVTLLKRLNKSLFFNARIYLRSRPVLDCSLTWPQHCHMICLKSMSFLPGGIKTSYVKWELLVQTLFVGGKHRGYLNLSPRYNFVKIPIAINWQFLLLQMTTLASHMDVYLWFLGYVICYIRPRDCPTLHDSTGEGFAPH